MTAMYVWNIMDCLGIGGIQFFLNKMAEKGWNLESGNLLFYKFIKGDSKKYTAVPEDFFHVTPEMAEQCGWEYLYSKRDMAYFRSAEEEPASLLTADHLCITEKSYQRLLIGCMIPIMLKYSLESLTVNHVQYICYCVSIIVYAVSFIMGTILNYYDASVLRRTGSLKKFPAIVYGILTLLGCFKQVSWVLVIMIFIMSV